MVNNLKIAQLFANGNTSGRTENLYIEGNTIYSYGPHFPVARRTQHTYKRQPVFSFNDRDYSATTRRHKSLVYRALVLNGAFVVFVPNANLLPAEAETMIKYHTGKIKDYKNSYDNARTEHYKGVWSGRIDSAREQIKFLKSFLKKN